MDLVPNLVGLRRCRIQTQVARASFFRWIIKSKGRMQEECVIIVYI